MEAIAPFLCQLSPSALASSDDGMPAYISIPSPCNLQHFNAVNGSSNCYTLTLVSPYELGNINTVHDVSDCYTSTPPNSSELQYFNALNDFPNCYAGTPSDSPTSLKRLREDPVTSSPVKKQPRLENGRSRFVSLLDEYCQPGIKNSSVNSRNKRFSCDHIESIPFSSKSLKRINDDAANSSPSKKQPRLKNDSPGFVSLLAEYGQPGIKDSSVNSRNKKISCDHVESMPFSEKSLKRMKGDVLNSPLKVKQPLAKNHHSVFSLDEYGQKISESNSVVSCNRKRSWSGIGIEGAPPTPPKKIKQLTFAVQDPGKFDGYAFKQHVTPKKRALTKKEVESSPLIVEYNENGSPFRAFKKSGDELVELFPSMKTRDLCTFASSSKFRPLDVYDPLNRSSIKPLFPEITQFSGANLVTKEVIAARVGKRKTDKPTLAQAMAYWKATDSAKAAGVAVTGQYHFAHLERTLFTPKGQKANDPKKIIVCTAAANFQHLQLEDTARALVTEHGSVVTEWRIPEDQKIFDPVFHVFGEVIYEIYTAKQELIPDYQAGKIGIGELKGALLQSFKIESLNPNFPHTNDRKYFIGYAYACLLRARGYELTSDDYELTPETLKF